MKMVRSWTILIIQALEETVEQVLEKTVEQALEKTEEQALEKTVEQRIMVPQSEVERNKKLEKKTNFEIVFCHFII